MVDIMILGMNECFCEIMDGVVVGKYYFNY